MNLTLLIVGIIGMLTVVSIYLIKRYKQSKQLILYLVITTVLFIGQAIFMYIVFEHNTLVHSMRLFALECGIAAVAYTDYRELIIPNEVILSLLVLRVILYVWELMVYQDQFLHLLKDSLTAFLLIGLFLIVIRFIAKDSVGFGDIKLMITMAIYQGFFGVFSSLFLSLLITSIIAIILLITKKKKKKDTVAFAPSVLAGLFLSITLTGI